MTEKVYENIIVMIFFSKYIEISSKKGSETALSTAEQRPERRDNL